MKTLTIGNLEIQLVGAELRRICYMLYPMELPAAWFEALARQYGVSLAVISGMDWDNDMTPWPAPGEPPGCPDFKGDAPAFLKTLTGRIVPEAERILGIDKTPERTLMGVSLSGLFTLWQWMTCDVFHNIITLSGSFWYPGFERWITSRPVPAGKGRAYFLLGDKEAHTSVKAFQPVQKDTEAIITYLRAQGIQTRFDLVPGNHYQHAEQRLRLALTRMFAATNGDWPVA